ncbi:hypothetical protein MON38_20445 [Hymenobacter sp. DH14]|uniref:Uncharacterized protein n=1 Tax=Hymenobacter cyanobacteriorum TaxID=2926463 RepID=A0A9X1VII3_9BACT|nr:hypothetical protein [Hymenobacter cyanobacteriorum]MCI1189799.1 hypothetical protein [Hymenobacter cyanobacteriorum]
MCFSRPPIVLTCTPAGRRLTFEKQGLETARVCRRLSPFGTGWELLNQNANSPFVDAEPYPAGTIFEYQVQYFCPQGAYRGASNIVCTNSINCNEFPL